MDNGSVTPANEPQHTSIERNTEYDPFAASYNRNWGADYRAEALPIVERLLLARIPHGGGVLDLCCGTGQFTLEIQARGFDVEGLDASGEMIRYARQNAPGVKFTVEDARDFDLGRKFAAVYSVFESLNHIPGIEDLLRVFRCVKSHLTEHGSFLFDLNREEAFEVYWNTTDAIVDPDHAIAMRSNYDPESKLATCDMTVFEPQPGNQWSRRDFTVRQTCHDLGAVQNALHEAGFAHVSFIDAADAGMEGAAGYARTFFLATL